MRFRVTLLGLVGVFVVLASFVIAYAGEPERPRTTRSDRHCGCLAKSCEMPCATCCAPGKCVCELQPDSPTSCSGHAR